MSVDPPRKMDIEYLRILASEMQNIPAWKEMAEAARQILGAEVDDRRRKLEKIRDSVRHRRGDVLVNLDYEPEPGKPMVDAVTGVPFTGSPEGIQFRLATVKNVIQNLKVFQMDNTVDYLDVLVSYKGRDYRWLMPFTATQERDILLRNAYMLGFDFFNTKMNDQDLRRLVEFIQIYWNDAGAGQNFMDFIGFVKNQRFDLVPLWTEGRAEAPDTPGVPGSFPYPYLEAFDPDLMRSVSTGGRNYLTSHVAIEYDLAQFTQFYTINLDDLEQLFYYFAPIILVLERVIGYLTVETTIGIAAATGLVSYDGDLWQLDDTFTTEVPYATASGMTITDGDIWTMETTFSTSLQEALGSGMVIYQHGILEAAAS